MGYQARRRHRIELLTSNAKRLALQRLDDRLGQPPSLPVAVDELCAMAAEAADQFVASADGDLPLTTDDVKMVVETLLLGLLAARLFVLDSIAMITRVTSRLAALDQAARAAMNETADPPSPS